MIKVQPTEDSVIAHINFNVLCFSAFIFESKYGLIPKGSICRFKESVLMLL